MTDSVTQMEKIVKQAEDLINTYVKKLEEENEKLKKIIEDQSKEIKNLECALKQPKPYTNKIDWDRRIGPVNPYDSNVWYTTTENTFSLGNLSENILSGSVNQNGTQVDNGIKKQLV